MNQITWKLLLIYEIRDFYSKNIKKMSIYKSIVVDLTNGKIK